MGELKEIEFIYKVKIATYDPEHFTKHLPRFHEALQSVIYDVTRAMGLPNEGNLTIKYSEDKTNGWLDI